jgi:sec-independent protein translocase protein TatB
MFDVGWSELVVIGVVSLVVIGPKELPGVIRNVGRAVAKLRTMAGDFRNQFDDAMREADLADVQKSFTDAKDVATSAYQAATNPVSTLKDEIASSVASINESARSLEADLAAATNVTLPTAADVTTEPLTVVAEAEAAPVAEETPKPKRRKKAVEEAPVEPAAEQPAEEAPKPKRRKKTAAQEGEA